MSNDIEFASKLLADGLPKPFSYISGRTPSYFMLSYVLSAPRLLIYDFSSLFLFSLSPSASQPNPYLHLPGLSLSMFCLIPSQTLYPLPSIHSDSFLYIYIYRIKIKIPFHFHRHFKRIFTIYIYARAPCGLAGGVAFPANLLM